MIEACLHEKDQAVFFGWVCFLHFVSSSTRTPRGVRADGQTKLDLPPIGLQRNGSLCVPRQANQSDDVGVVQVNHSLALLEESSDTDFQKTVRLAHR